ncbi:hypothetical protein BX281_1277 [Streptomyces sp. Ag82_O1-15]|nr:hypothetical protein BX281_1277 [Streptomyces sp. Ag82_O1-15]
MACHCFLSFAVAGGGVPRWVLGVIYELAESRVLPIEVQGEDATLRYRLGAMHRPHEPERAVDRASDEDKERIGIIRRSAAGWP